MDKRIGIAGLGGIGSRVAEILVRSGEKQLTLVDFDRVEPSNLDRQFYFANQIGELKTEMLRQNLEKIQPGIKIKTVNQKMDSKNISLVFSDCNIIVEGFDKKESKKMLVEAFCNTPKRVVSASGIAGNDLDSLGEKQIGNCTIFGDFLTDEAVNELFPPKVLVVAAMMAGRILKLTDKRNS